MYSRSKNAISFCLLCVLLYGFFSCSKNDQNTAPAPTAGIQNFSLFPGKDITDMDPSRHRISVRVPDSVVSGTALIASFNLTAGATLSLNGLDQQSGITKNDFETDLHYTVTSSDRHDQEDWTVQAFNNDYSISWGLGHFVNGQVSNDKSYNWYIDQSTSGNFAGVNCGPASVTMAIKWADSLFTKTALDARMTYESSGGWWYTNDIDAYLTDNHITHAIVSLADRADSTAAIMKQQLMNHQIVILCLDMNHVRATADTAYRADKFYSTTPDWGHFIVLKGFRVADGELFFEAYDPYSFGLTNDDYTLKGMNRYYRSEDLAAACLSWWNYIFVIAKKGNGLSLDAVNRKLNPAQVPAARGGTRIF